MNVDVRVRTLSHQNAQIHRYQKNKIHIYMYIYIYIITFLKKRRFSAPLLSKTALKYNYT